MSNAEADICERHSVSLTLHLPGGMHARPAARLAQEAQKFDAEIRVETEDGEADVKSMLDVLTLTIPDEAAVTLTAEGPDARAALEGISALLAELRK